MQNENPQGTLNQETDEVCPCCPNHCPIADLHCNRGREHFGLSTVEGKDHGCGEGGHCKHHGGNVHRGDHGHHGKAGHHDHSYEGQERRGH